MLLPDSMNKDEYITVFVSYRIRCLGYHNVKLRSRRRLFSRAGAAMPARGPCRRKQVSVQRRINGDTSRRTGLYSDGDHYDLPAGFKSSSGSESGSNRGSNPSSGPVPVMLGLGPGLGLGVRPQNSGFGLCLGLAFEGLGYQLLTESPIWYPATIV